jgi:hypothetical protein
MVRRVVRIAPQRGLDRRALSWALRELADEGERTRTDVSLSPATVRLLADIVDDRAPRGRAGALERAAIMNAARLEFSRRQADGASREQAIEEIADQAGIAEETARDWIEGRRHKV